MSTNLLTRGTTTTGVVPRVNLIPPEIAEAAKLQRLKVILGGAAVACVGVVGMVWLVAAGQVTSAQQDLDVAIATTANLQQQVTALAQVPATFAAVAAAEGQLNDAMGEEVRWSFALNDLSLTIPNNVGIDSLTIAQATGPGVVEGVTGPVGTPGMATISFEGEAAEQNDVAAFLDSLAKQPNYVDPYFTSSTLEPGEGANPPVYVFSATTTVTDEAKSGRYVPEAG